LLIAEEVEAGITYLDLQAVAGSGKQAVDDFTSCFEEADDFRLAKQGFPFGNEVLPLLAVIWHLPGRAVHAPIDAGCQILQAEVGFCEYAVDLGFGALLLLASLEQGLCVEGLALFWPPMLFPQLLIDSLYSTFIGFPIRAYHLFCGQGHGRCILGLNYRLGVEDGELDRRMQFTGGRTPNKYGNGGTLLFKQLDDILHLLQRRCDQGAQPDQVCLVTYGSFPDDLGRNHHPEVDHNEAIAAKNQIDDVLADIMHIALDSGHHGNRPFLTA